MALDRQGYSRGKIREATHAPERTQTIFINQSTRRPGKNRVDQCIEGKGLSPEFQCDYLKNGAVSPKIADFTVVN